MMITTIQMRLSQSFLLVGLLLPNFCRAFSLAPPIPSASSQPMATFEVPRTCLFASTTDNTASTAEATSSSSSGWKPQLESLEERKSLRNANANTETIGSLGFHHVEFYCGDARSTANHFCTSLGMSVTGTTGQFTGNDKCVSYGLESGERFRLLLTAPYSRARAASNDNNNSNDNQEEYDAPSPLPSFGVEHAHGFFQKHGLAARAIGVEVVDAQKAFEASVAGGATPVLEPTFLPACKAQCDNDNNNDGGCYISEVELYGDVVLRYVSYPSSNGNSKNNSIDANSEGIVTEADADDATGSSGTATQTRPFLPHLAPVEQSSTSRQSYGIYRIDHAVGNVHDLQEAHSRIRAFTGFHEFAEFTSEDVGTVDSGLNSVVLASDSEEVLLPLNEPTHGRRKSQIQTYLEQNEGPGLQHLALKTRDIFSTVRKMRGQSQRDLFGFELMTRPSEEYYRELPDRLGDQLTPDQYEELEELGILADSDEEGILLQLFTKPVGDRPTFFFEIIQRIGCVISYDETSPEISIERPGCGGFGQGNFRELFKSIEDHEKTLKV